MSHKVLFISRTSGWGRDKNKLCMTFYVVNDHTRMNYVLCTKYYFFILPSGDDFLDMIIPNSGDKLEGYPESISLVQSLLSKKKVFG